MNENMMQPQSQPSALVSVEQSRAMQDVQAALIIAQRFPRDEIKALGRILKSCERKGLAEKAEYCYPRGDQTVKGPTIRLTEVLALNWGNIKFGVDEIDRGPDYSDCMAYCWDQETNTRKDVKFRVGHYRNTKKDRYQLTDDRDIYEMVANQGARRLRSCILAIIPVDVVDQAIEVCRKTITGGNTDPIQDRIVKLVRTFEKFGVNQQMIEEKLKHKLDIINEEELADFLAIFNSLKDGMTKREDWFTVTKDDNKTVTDALKGKKGDSGSKKTKKDDETTSQDKEKRVNAILDGLGQNGYNEMDLERLHGCRVDELSDDEISSVELDIAKMNAGNMPERWTLNK